MAVMVLHFTDAAAMAMRLSGVPRCISDEIACALQQIATTNGIPYLKMTGYEIVAAAGQTRRVRARLVRSTLALV
jgi:hypothetical protein